MMTETYTLSQAVQIAKNAASEAIESLLSVYWADSFDVENLEAKLADVILPMTCHACRVEDAHPSAELLEEAIAPTPISELISDGTSEDAGEDPSPQPVEHPLLDLRDRPSPDILRVLAIGSPQVVNNFVMTMFQLGYAHSEEWSRQLPTVNPGEVMRILTKRVMLPT